MNSKSQVVVVPDFREGNPYQSILSENLEKLGHEVTFDKYPVGYFPFSELCKKHPDAKVIHLHWLSPLLTILSWTASPLKAKLRCLLIALDCLKLRMSGKTIVWTIHNKFAHEGFDRNTELFLRKLLVSCVSQIIVHSESAKSRLAEAYNSTTIKRKAKVIFHGNYTGMYPAADTSRDALLTNLGIPVSSTLILCFGMLRKYKGIEKLATIFNTANIPDNFHLLICGKADDQKYADELIAICEQSPQVHLQLGFLSDAELSNWLSAADLVAVPFSDTLTSGSVILAMTEGKALLLSEVSKVFDCVPDNGAVFYNSENEIANKLQSLSQQEIANMGVINKRIADTMNWEEVAKLTSDCYDH